MGVGDGDGVGDGVVFGDGVGSEADDATPDKDASCVVPDSVFEDASADSRPEIPKAANKRVRRTPQVAEPQVEEAQVETAEAAEAAVEE